MGFTCRAGRAASSGRYFACANFRYERFVPHELFSFAANLPKIAAMQFARIGSLAVTAALIVATGAACRTSSTATETTLTVDRQSVALHYFGNTDPQPLVIALHGIGSDGKTFEKDSGLDAFADAHGFAVAYPDAHVAPDMPVPPMPTATPTPDPTPTPSPSPPAAPSPTASPTTIAPGALRATSIQGQRAARAAGLVEDAHASNNHSTDRAWNAGICCGGSTADDVTYLKHVLTAVEGHVLIDRKRVYVIGVSNGGMMALKAICSAPRVFAAAGSVAGPYLGSHCARPVWRHLHGGKDVIVPYHGGSPPGSAYLGVAPDWCLCSFPDSATESARFSRTTVSVKLVKTGLHSWPQLGDGAWNLDADSDLWGFVSRYHL